MAMAIRLAAQKHGDVRGNSEREVDIGQQRCVDRIRRDRQRRIPVQQCDLLAVDLGIDLRGRLWLAGGGIFLSFTRWMILSLPLAASGFGFCGGKVIRHAMPVSELSLPNLSGSIHP